MLPKVNLNENVQPRVNVNEKDHVGSNNAFGRLLWDGLYVWTGIRAAILMDERLLQRHVAIVGLTVPTMLLVARVIDPIQNGAEKISSATCCNCFVLRKLR